MLRPAGTIAAHRSVPCSLTIRSSRAPTAGHQARSGGTRYIFASRARASHRWCRLNSNVRHHNREQRHVSISTNANANTNSVLSSGSPEFQPQHATCLCRGLSHRMLRPQCCLTPRSRRGPTSKRQARAVGWRIFHRTGLAFCCRSRLSSNVRRHNHRALLLCHSAEFSQTSAQMTLLPVETSTSSYSASRSTTIATGTSNCAVQAHRNLSLASLSEHISLFLESSRLPPLGCT